MQGTINPVSDYIVVERVMAEEVVNHRIGQANPENRHEVTGLVVVGHAFFFNDLSQQHCNMPRNLTTMRDLRSSDIGSRFLKADCRQKLLSHF